MINENTDNPPVYVEPFAGGAGLALELLFNGVVNRVKINDFDPAIYSFWYSITTEETFHLFVDYLDKVEVNIEEWYHQKDIYLNQSNHSQLELGFATFFLNRCNRSGILKAGPIGGKKQDGKYKIDCRFNKDKLKSLINKIYEYRNQIDVTNENAEDFIKRIDQYYDDLFIYLDPPYVEKGSSLYKNSFEMKDHISLCNAIKELDNKWFVTYDNNDLIKDLYSEYTLKLFDINYSAGSKRKENEIAVYSNNLRYKIVP